MSTNLLSKKALVVVAIVAAGAVSAILVTSLSMSQATAQEQQEQQRRMMMWSDDGGRIPQINGSVSVTEEARDFINENVNVSFTAAAETAQGQVPDGRVFGGHLGVVQGYLVYTFFVASTGNQTGHMVIVDAGNGNVLYTSEGHSLGSFGPLGGHWGGHGGFAPWHGPWKGHHWGMWS
ncbi:MAG TPA: hypothetical protein VF172_11865 [Nitrososphaera sp.]|jgi:uncharacterized membrane protein YkoI